MESRFNVAEIVNIVADIVIRLDKEIYAKLGGKKPKDA